MAKTNERIEKRAVLYARVSSKEQEKEGFSIPAQEKLLEGYARDNGFRIEQRFVDVETAKRAGRSGFAELVALLQTDPKSRVLIVEKTDRLYRNFKDYVTLDDIEGLEIHFVKEGTVISRDSRSSEKFNHGIKVLMAKNYIDNLSEETRKGMTEKASQGIWPSFAPLGYKNVEGSNGKRIIVPDEALAPMILRLFELCATGRHSIKDLGARVREEGFTGRGQGLMPTSTVHKILRNRVYSGDFDWDGKRYEGTHEPIVSADLWEQAQRALDGRLAKRAKKVDHSFPFSGLLICGHCGCALVGEIKKARYVYYHCSGAKGKCPEPYVRQEVLEAEFGNVLRLIAIDEEVARWVADALRQSHTDEKRFREEAVSRLTREHERIQGKLEALYEDRLDGRVDLAFFDRKSRELRDDQARIRREIDGHQAANESYMEAGIRILELSRSMHRLFAKQPAEEKRRLLDFVVSNCSWKGGALTPTFRQPFDMLAVASSQLQASTVAGGSESARNENWLPILNALLTPLRGLEE
ncbi:MAG: recombinase family protein [Bryobacteraceae bacterium]|jgi:DNA invertase Pin-like site-specific DNA recombinase